MAVVVPSLKTKFVILGGEMVVEYASKQLIELGMKPSELAIVSADTSVPFKRSPLVGRDRFILCQPRTIRSVEVSLFYSSSTKGLVQGNGPGHRALIKRKLSYVC